MSEYMSECEAHIHVLYACWHGLHWFTVHTALEHEAASSGVRPTYSSARTLWRTDRQTDRQTDASWTQQWVTSLTLVTRHGTQHQTRTHTVLLSLASYQTSPTNGSQPTWRYFSPTVHTFTTRWIYCLSFPTPFLHSLDDAVSYQLPTEALSTLSLNLLLTNASYFLPRLGVTLNVMFASTDNDINWTVKFGKKQCHYQQHKQHSHQPFNRHRSL